MRKQSKSVPEIVLVRVPAPIPELVDVHLKENFIRYSVSIRLCCAIGGVVSQIAGLQHTSLMKRPFCQLRQKFFIA